MKIITKLKALAFLVGIVALIALILSLSQNFEFGNSKSNERRQSSSSITSLEKVKQVVFLDAGIQKVETSKKTSKLIFTQLDIPWSEKKTIIILNYHAKFGIKQPVKIENNSEGNYTVRVPKFEVIGVELSKDKPYELYDTSKGVLSYSTEDVDTGDMVADALSDKDQETYLKQFTPMIKESAEEYYKQMITSIDSQANVKVVFEK